MTRKLLLTTALLTISALPALAEDNPWTTKQAAPQQDIVTLGGNANEASPEQDQVMTQIKALQKEWARIKYQVPEKEAQLQAIHKLEEQAAQITAQNPDRAEPKIWEGIILSTDAGIVKGLSALGKVNKAKELFETSLKQDPKALDGSAHTSLGSLYYQVPGWPIAFGDDEQAEKHLKTALQINPDGIDPNFFYGDFLLQDDRPDEAKKYLEHALAAPDREDRALADAGRRQEIKAALAKIEEENKHKKKYN